MSPTKFDKPPIQSNSAGVLFVRSADILASRVGREQIQSAAAIAVDLGLRKGEPDGVKPAQKG